VDYVQLLDTRARFGASDNHLRVGYISNALTALAKELNIPVIALAQLRRQYKDQATMPRLDALKDSGSLEQDADGVILLHEPTWRGDDALREEERTLFDACVDTPRRIKLLNVEKQRNGEKGVVGAIFDGSRNRWAPIQRRAGA
jgi:replicative DNA helicase